MHVQLAQGIGSAIHVAQRAAARARLHAFVERGDDGVVGALLPVAGGVCPGRRGARAPVGTRGRARRPAPGARPVAHRTSPWKRRSEGQGARMPSRRGDAAGDDECGDAVLRPCAGRAKRDSSEINGARFPAAAPRLANGTMCLTFSSCLAPTSCGAASRAGGAPSRPSRCRRFARRRRRGCSGSLRSAARPSCRAPRELPAIASRSPSGCRATP